MDIRIKQTQLKSCTQIDMAVENVVTDMEPGFANKTTGGEDFAMCVVIWGEKLDDEAEKVERESSCVTRLLLSYIIALAMSKLTSF